MQIDLICMGKNRPTWVNTGVNEYTKRLPSYCNLTLKEIPLRKRTKNADLVRLQQQEGEQMLAAIVPHAHVIALDECGAHWNTIQLTEQLSHWISTYSTVALLIGGPEGLATVCSQRAQQYWSLSRLTLPHPLVRIIVAEQLYRAWSYLNNHPYHRA